MTRFLNCRGTSILLAAGSVLTDKGKLIQRLFGTISGGQVQGLYAPARGSREKYPTPNCAKLLLPSYFA
jgi:hypothetical protein